MTQSPIPGAGVSGVGTPAASVPAFNLPAMPAPSVADESKWIAPEWGGGDAITATPDAITATPFDGSGIDGAASQVGTHYSSVYGSLYDPNGFSTNTGPTVAALNDAQIPSNIGDATTTDASQPFWSQSAQYQSDQMGGPQNWQVDSSEGFPLFGATGGGDAGSGGAGSGGGDAGSGGGSQQEIISPGSNPSDPAPAGGAGGGDAGSVTGSNGDSITYAPSSGGGAGGGLDAGGGGMPVTITDLPGLDKSITGTGSELDKTISATEKAAAATGTGWLSSFEKSITDWLVRFGLIALAIALLAGAWVFFRTDAEAKL